MQGEPYPRVDVGVSAGNRAGADGRRGTEKAATGDHGSRGIIPTTTAQHHALLKPDGQSGSAGPSGTRVVVHVD